MKAYKGSKALAPLILNIVARKRYVICFKLRLLHSRGRNLGTHSMLDWMGTRGQTFWKREKHRDSTRIQTPDSPVGGLVTKTIHLSQIITFYTVLTGSTKPMAPKMMELITKTHNTQSKQK
jgi:hypothetical protein